MKWKQTLGAIELALYLPNLICLILLANITVVNELFFNGLKSRMQRPRLILGSLRDIAMNKAFSITSLR